MYPLQMLAKCPLAKCLLAKRPLAICPDSVSPYWPHHFDIKKKHCTYLYTVKLEYIKLGFYEYMV